MRLRYLSLLTLAILAAPALGGELRPAASNDDLTQNPHRGFLLWGTTVGAEGGLPENHYGATMYQIYLPWREVETADQQFDWAGFEQRHLAPILAERPNATFVLRPVADYPNGEVTKINHYYTGGEPERDYPKFLELPPLNIKGNDYVRCDKTGPGRAPDYNSAAMREQMQQFIRALAARYDGDPRITAIHVGLLGFWGEWHTEGCADFEPDATTRQVVRDTYAQAFKYTPLHTRYARKTDVGGVDFGFSEDFFPTFTAACDAFRPALPDCDDEGFWNLEWGFRNEVPAARENWRANPIGGESPEETQKDTWTQRTNDIVKLLRDYHFSWLGPAGKHEEAGFAAKMRTIKRALGYEFTVRQVNWPDSMRAGAAIPVTLSVENTGSAPLYHLYRTEVQWVDAGGATRARAPFAYPLNELMPGASARSVTANATVPSSLATGSYSLRLALVADTTAQRPGIAPQNAGRDSQGRLTLGTVTVTPP